MKTFSVLLNGGFCALNAGLFAAYGNWWSLAAAVFSGLVALYVALSPEEY